MALFQPTFISPSSLWGTDNGVVDATKDLTVSFKVNGSSPLTAFQIDVLDSNSVQIYSTGKITDGCPFYNTNADGEAVLFSYTIPHNAIAGGAPTVSNKTYDGSGITSLTLNDATFLASQYGKDGTYTFSATTSGRWTSSSRTGSWLIPNGSYVEPDDTISSSVLRSTYGVELRGTVSSGNTITIDVATPSNYQNGNAYLLRITQWWSDNDSIVQNAPQPFSTAAIPTTAISDIPSPLQKRSHTFSFNATYGSSDNDAIRWQIARADNLASPIYDTGMIYGSGNQTFTYDGFINGVSYAVNCTILARVGNGIEVSTGWQTFDCSYAVDRYKGNIKTAQIPDGINIDWSDLQFISGVGTGDYSIAPENLMLYDTSSVTWNSRNDGTLDFVPPWSLALKTVLPVVTGKKQVLFNAVCSNGLPIEIGTQAHRVTIRVAGGTSGYLSTNPIYAGATLTVLLTASNAYIRIDNLSGGLYPGNDKNPSTALYPMDNTGVSTTTETIALTYTQSTIQSMTLYSIQNTIYLWVGRGTATNVSDFMDDPDYRPKEAEGTEFYCDFSDGFNAGNALMASGKYIGMNIYRLDEGDDTLKFVGFSESDSIIDYSARNQVASRWYAFALSDTDTELATPVISSQTTPLYWTWSILECEDITTTMQFVPTNNDVYRLIRAYDFKANFESGSISNNNGNNLVANFTRYPTVMRSPQNYQSGTLTALIGSIGVKSDGTYGYYDTIASRDAIYNLSTTNNTLFLKNPKGDLIKIVIAGAISMTAMDSTREQATTATIPWAEIGDTKNVSIVG